MPMRSHGHLNIEIIKIKSSSIRSFYGEENSRDSKDITKRSMLEQQQSEHVVEHFRRKQF